MQNCTTWRSISRLTPSITPHHHQQQTATTDSVSSREQPGAGGAPPSSPPSSPPPQVIHLSTYGSMYGVVVVFMAIVGLVSVLAMCYHSRRNQQRRQARAAALAGAQHAGGTELAQGLPPGHRMGVVAAESRSGRHIIILGPVAAAAAGRYATSAAAAAPLAPGRQLLQGGKLPTPPAVIDNLPTYEFTPPPGAARIAAAEEEGSEKAGKADDDDGGSRPVCVICCDEFVAGTVVKLLPCMHSFCAECIDSWLARDTHCPICKESVLTAAGLSEDDVVEIMRTSDALGGDRRRQIDNAALRPGGGAAAAAAAAAAPDLQLQAQQQRLWQLSAMQAHAAGRAPPPPPGRPPQQPGRPG